jgi:hypothetical protein
MQEWLNLTRDDVSHLRLTPPLVSLFGWFSQRPYWELRGRFGREREKEMKEWL